VHPNYSSRKQFTLPRFDTVSRKSMLIDRRGLRYIMKLYKRDIYPDTIHFKDDEDPLFSYSTGG
jgi:hypothetical protein